MSFTEAGFKRMVAGEFASGFVVGRLGVQLISIGQDQIIIKYFIAASGSNEVVYEYDQLPMSVGEQVLLDGVEVKIPFEIEIV